MFPFQHNNKTYSQCTEDENPDKTRGWGGSKTWCATKVEGGKVVRWDDCAEDNCADKTVGEWRVANSPCNTVDNEICVFPFTYKEVIHYKCTAVDSEGVLWCSTETKDNGDHVLGKWGNCKEDCPTCTTTDGHFCQTECRSQTENDQPKCKKRDSTEGYHECEDSCSG